MKQTLHTVGERHPFQDAQLPTKKRIENLLSLMSLAEKVRQLDIYDGAEFCAADGSFAWQDFGAVCREAPVGGLQSRNGTCDSANGEMARRNNEIQRLNLESARLPIPILFSEEALHGLMWPGCTVFAQQIALAGTFLPQLAQQTGRAIAKECRSLGIHETWSPVLDLARDPRWGRVEEGYGEDTYLASRFAEEMIWGLQGEGLAEEVLSSEAMLAEVKHFSGYGAPCGGLNCAPATMGRHEHAMYCLPVFAAAFGAGAFNAMCSYNSIDGIPVAQDRSLLTDTLRGQFHLRGFVRCDMTAMAMLHSSHHVAASRRQAIRQALEAGVDVQLYDFPHDFYQQTLIDLVRSGELAEQVIDQSVRRVLRAKFALGLFEQPFVCEQRSLQVVHCPAHVKLAAEVAEKAICLLKNHEQTLPLSKDLRCLSVLGPSAAEPRFGGYSAPVQHTSQHTSAITLLDGIKEQLTTEIRYAQGCAVWGQETQEAQATLAKQALGLIAGSDAVILALGDSEETCGENVDRTELHLPGYQREFAQQVQQEAAAHKIPVILVLQNGRPLSLSWEAEHLAAIVEAWYAGEQGGRAIARVLFGEVNPAGRLPLSFPRSVGQLPVHYNRRPGGGKKYLEMDWQPLYPFGYGLSYTSFAYENMHLSLAEASLEDLCAGRIEVSVKVVNTGGRYGEEVVQLYLHDAVSCVVRPYKELCGFVRVGLKPGERRTVRFTLEERSLRLLRPDFQWRVEPGEFMLMLGPNSAEVWQQTQLLLR